MITKVKLRQKAISENRQSLYLDFYPPIPHPETGKPTRREFLGLYIHNKANKPTDKTHNTETLQLAEQIRQKRENHLNKPEIYTGFELEQLKIKEMGEQNFVEYFKKLANERKLSNSDNWSAAFKYLDKFTKGNLKFSELNEKRLNEFKEYLLTTKSNKSDKTTLAKNSAVSYFNKVKATLKQAYKDGYLQSDLNAKIAPIPEAETRREFLTLEELNSLVKTECNNPLLKRAALFSALTGMRFSDIKNLVWGEVAYTEGKGYNINFTQQKTNGIEYMPISEQAFQLMGERKEPNEQVFEGLTYSAYENRHLFQWIGAAGITKKITFHCFRHTFATLQLSKRPDGSAGTDIYTVSKMLGHRDLKTTQIYAKIIDQSKRDAADKIQLDL
jgi:integrase